MDVLREIGGEAGLVLWRALRRVEVWLEQDHGSKLRRPVADERNAILTAGEEAPELIEAMGTFSLMRQAPGVSQSSQVADACKRVAEWAYARHRLRSAALFAEAAAYVAPDEAGSANDAARACRRAALNERASLWFARGFSLAVRSKSRRESIRALLGYGGLLFNLGRHDEARVVLEKASRRAERFGRRRQAAEAQHDLLAIASEAGSYAAGERHFREALRLYPSRHPRLPYLVHDFAYMLSQHRLYAPALPLLRAVVPVLNDPAEQVLVSASVARAAAGAGHLALHREAAERTARLAIVYEEHAAAALSHLAEAAQMLGLWDKAANFAEMAVEVATARGEGEPRERAQRIIDAATRRLPHPGAASPPERNRIDALTRRALGRLRAWRSR